jgi:hypothetical protein
MDRRSNDKNGVYPTTNLLNGVGRVFIKNEGVREINYGICIAASRPDRTNPGIHCIVLSNDKYGVYATKNLLKGVALVSIKRKEFDKLICKLSRSFTPRTLYPRYSMDRTLE